MAALIFVFLIVIFFDFWREIENDLLNPVFMKRNHPDYHAIIQFDGFTESWEAIELFNDQAADLIVVLAFQIQVQFIIEIMQG